MNRLPIIIVFIILIPTTAILARPQVIARWTFDRNEDAVAADVSGNGHDGRIHGAKRVRARGENALEFDGKDDFVTIPPAEAFNLTESMTIEAWAKLDELGDHHDRVIIARSDHPKAFDGWNLTWGYGSDIYWGHDGEYRFITGVPAQQWTHFVLVCSLRGHRLTLFINGEARGEYNWHTPLPESEFPVTIGRRGQGHFFSGLIDDVTIYDGVLTRRQVAARFAGRPMPEIAAPPEPQASGNFAHQLPALGAWQKHAPQYSDHIQYQNLYLGLVNRASRPLEMKNVWVQGRPTDRPELRIDGEPGQFLFAGIEPSKIRPDAAGVLNLKYIGCGPVPARLHITMETASGEIRKTTANFAAPPAHFAALAFDDDLTAAWAHLRAKTDIAVNGITIHGAPAKATIASPRRKAASGQLLPLRLEFDRPLDSGIPVLITIRTSAGPAFTFLRPYPARFPIGMYRVQRQGVPAGWQPADGRQRLEQYRHTFAYDGETGQPPDAWLKDCRAHHIDTLVPDYVNHGGDPSIAAEFGLQVVPYGRHADRYADHEAIAAWYSADEPRGDAPATFQQITNSIRTHDKTRPVVVTINPPVLPRVLNFDFIDCGYQDTYPVPVAPLEKVADNTALYREAIAPKPVVFIPQCFRRAPGLDHGWSRFPTPHEERLMVMMAIAAGARGLAYFAYNVEPTEPIEGCGVSTAPEAKRLWNEIGRINLQLQTIAPLLKKSCVFAGHRDGAIQASTIIARNNTAIIITINHDYQYSQKTFTPHPKQTVRIRPPLPAWLEPDNCFTVRPDSIADIPFRDGHVTIDSIQSAAIAVISSDDSLKSRLIRRFNKLQN